MEEYTGYVFGIMVVSLIVIFIITTTILIRDALKEEVEFIEEVLNIPEDKEDEDDGYKNFRDYNKSKADWIGYLAIGLYILMIFVIFFVIL